MGSLLSSGSTAPKAISSAQDYINAFKQGGGGPSSDIGSSILGDIGSGAGLAGSLIGSLPTAGLSLGLAIPSLISNLSSMFSGRSSTGPGSATADIAGAGSAYSDPIIKLLSAGAGNLPSGTPISASDGSASSFGPYFDLARKLEDPVRWGFGGVNPKTEALDATTLKNALTEMGNPGKAGTGTLSGIQNAWNSFIQKNPPGSDGWNQFLELQKSLTGPEKTIFDQFFGQGGGGGGNPPPGSPPNFPSPTGNPLGANTNPGSSPNPLSTLGAIAPLLIAGQNINPMQPIRLPDQGTNQVGPGNNQQKGKQKNPNLMAQLLALLSQNGQSE